MALEFLKSLLAGKEDIPAPGTEPTYDDNGILTDPGNPWIGFPDPSNPRRTIPASGKQRRYARRAEQRREAAKQRIGQRAYDRGNKALEQSQAQARARRRTLTAETRVSPDLYNNVVADEKRRHKLGDPQMAELAEQDRRDKLTEDALDRAEQRRIRRFLAGKPRGKDLREAVMNEYSHYLPSSYWTVKQATGRSPKAGKNGATK